jgi:O-6-methylguanine DNA methyltransferase
MQLTARPEEDARMIRIAFAADGRVERILIGEGLARLVDALAGRAAGEMPGIIRRVLNKPPDFVLEFLTAFFSGADLRRYYAQAVETAAPWQARAMQAMASVPRGKVVSYGGLAGMLAAPRAARAAGSACARNPLPLLYPCHRVVRADGRIGAFMSREGGALKRRLLEFEGVIFDERGRIRAECFAE